MISDLISVGGTFAWGGEGGATYCITADIIFENFTAGKK